MQYLKISVLTSFLVFPAMMSLAIAEQTSDREPVFLEQNWNDDDRDYFYFTDQGSRLVPYDYFLNLEQADNSELLRDNDNMMSFGFLPIAKSDNNPDALPIGLARNKDYMGITCAACHTQEITYKDQFIRIDGGQSFLDLRLFISELTGSMASTLNDPDKLSRFQTRLLGENPSQRQKEALRTALEKQVEKRMAYATNNHSNTPYGFTRLDAFGAILNKALSATGVPNNFNEANAATSIPYIWDTPQHDYVEWNGSQSNAGVGALARNLGEVIGVFGEITTETTKWLGFIDGGYPSSIQAKNLRGLEHITAKLHSPLWPEQFPAVDEQLAQLGRGLYEQHCLQCHVDMNRTDPNRYIQVRMSTLDEVKTDPLMAENAIGHRGKTGIFENRKKFYFAGPELGEENRAIYVANNIMIGVLKNNPLQAQLAKRDAKKLGHPDVVHPPKYVDGEIIEHGQEVSDHALLAYKARPLNGVWSSAPYLHNGAIHNMYQLLLPQAERDTEFYLGSWQYDPKTLGYVNKASEGSFLFDTQLPGNSNSGHEYGTGAYGLPPLSEEQRWALIEYLKTL
jgi:processive rubber oxygenase RoxA-like protein